MDHSVYNVTVFYFGKFGLLDYRDLSEIIISH